MVDLLLQVLLWSFYLLSLVLHLFEDLKKLAFSIALTLNSSPSASPLSRYLSWVGSLFATIQSIYHHTQGQIRSNVKRRVFEQHGEENYEAKNLAHTISCQDSNSKMKEKNEDKKGMHGILHSAQKKSGLSGNRGSAINSKLRVRPAKLFVPDFCPRQEFIEMGLKKLKEDKKEFEVEGRDFCLASKKGARREFMEDGHREMVDIMGDPKQAFFAVIDGHGGCAAADYVAENLGKNIMKELEHVGEDQEHELQQAIRQGYSVTDKGFLSQGVSSGACAASVVLKDGVLHVANLGDCRVVLSNKGVAHVLTKDHRLSSEDERLRIENTGGFVQHCRNGVWRLQGSLAVSRAIGDQHLKDWVISEPETKTIPLTSDCEFLLMASDGLWDKVDNQEAVNVVLKEKDSLKSCKKLVNMSSSRGSMDDITVMVINLRSFLAADHLQ
ncbi:putative protein-serine/threonine phosphatase [Rosa chinensis]|uniref:PPM-type phosphatase domain-containing protein n=1 Tax=Rosa chinensis TaxID=74649 RepID=A0A2P6PKR8_ROSCH|nr:probable protein phosphatase 2C 32 [Rosa chinensis]PRQ22522.1 putative protein-serine/threonine phosphatase [Rosa chinensis]